MATWHMVHAWYLLDWLCSVRNVDSPWHSMHRLFTELRVSSRGLFEPCGTWHAVQPSVFTGRWLKTNGPRFSVWHFRQIRSDCSPNCGSAAADCSSHAAHGMPCSLLSSPADG